VLFIAREDPVQNILIVANLITLIILMGDISGQVRLSLNWY